MTKLYCIRMFFLMISRLCSNMGHVQSKTRSLAQIDGNSCNYSGSCMFRLRMLKLSECLSWWCLGQINPFPYMTILQQTTLNIFCQIMENLYNWMDNLWLKVDNIVTKEEIACFVQLLLLSLCFQKAVCCRGVRKRLYEGKG